MLLLMMMMVVLGGGGVSLAEGGVLVVWGVVGGGLGSLLLPPHPQQVPLQLLLQAGRDVNTVQLSEAESSVSERQVTSGSCSSFQPERLSFLHYILPVLNIICIDPFLCLFLLLFQIGSIK